ncbi:hypothetical protein EYF80_010759 [Liparis tanakae]|uniref:Uncharacterized protein n=1 Tax=Liparis tanakae TaxID=230148 RepID=A0A4Z2IM05_9TELE|nr:hypothetical protein EYF80_010759 [Liparis tanakae]
MTSQVCCAHRTPSLFAHFAGGPADLLRNGVFLSLGDLVDLVSCVQPVGAPFAPQTRRVPATCHGRTNHTHAFATQQPAVLRHQVDGLQVDGQRDGVNAALQHVQHLQLVAAHEITHMSDQMAPRGRR